MQDNWLTITSRCCFLFLVFTVLFPIGAPFFLIIVVIKIRPIGYSLIAVFNLFLEITRQLFPIVSSYATRLLSYPVDFPLPFGLQLFGS